MDKMNHERLILTDGLKGVAILAVALYHLGGGIYHSVIWVLISFMLLADIFWLKACYVNTNKNSFIIGSLYFIKLSDFGL